MYSEPDPAATARPDSYRHIQADLPVRPMATQRVSLRVSSGGIVGVALLAALEISVGVALLAALEISVGVALAALVLHLQRMRSHDATSCITPGLFRKVIMEQQLLC